MASGMAPSEAIWPVDGWPALPIKEWQATRDTLHMWTQIVGKIRLKLCALVNHWWEVPLYVTARGLTTSPIPYDGGVFEIQFDFIEHRLLDRDQRRAGAKTIRLAPRSVADFYEEVMAALHSLGIFVKIWTVPSEVPGPIRFEQDRVHASYDAEYVNRFWRILVSADTVFKEFRGRVHRQIQPSAFFLGELRSGGDAILRPARARAARRRRDYARGLFPRSDQRGFLAGNGGHRRRVLLLRGAGTAWLFEAVAVASRGVLQLAIFGISLEVR